MRPTFTQPLDLYRAARGLGRRPALLESLGLIVPFGRLTLLGTRCVRTLEAWDGVLFTNGRRDGEALDVLERLAERLGGSDELFPAWIGFFAYEFAGRLGLPATQPLEGLPEAAFRLYSEGHAWVDGERVAEPARSRGAPPQASRTASRPCSREAVRFHPESMLSPYGLDLLANFLELPAAHRLGVAYSETGRRR